MFYSSWTIIAILYLFLATVKGLRTPIEVTLYPLAGSKVTVSVTNTWDRDVRYFGRMNILDDNPVDKVTVRRTNDGQPSEFIGIRARILRENLSDDSLIAVPSRTTYNSTFDIADIYDLSNGGAYTISSKGELPWAESFGSNMLVGSATYSTNEITIHVPTGHAREKRSALEAGCVESRRSVAGNAVGACAYLSALASIEALNGDEARFARYFRTTSPSARKLVSDRYTAISRECSGGTRLSTVFCGNALNFCKSNYISVTYGDKITHCDIFWTLPPVSRKCHSYDQAVLMIHETSHVRGVLEQPTTDFKDNYGWPKLTRLNAAQALRNADNYQFYANSMMAGGDC